MGDKLTFGVVLTGGGVLLKDIEEKAGEVFNADTKVGYPLHIEGLEDVMHSPEYATATGLLLYGREHQEKYGAVRRPGGIGRFFGDLSGGVREFFRELF